MDQHLSIALLQVLPGASLAENCKIGREACRAAKKKGADIALFPEMWSDGYDIPKEMDTLKAKAISADSDFVCGFGRLAKELDLAIGITFLEAYAPLPRNTLVLFDRHGRRVLRYSKVHTCAFGAECRLTPGDDFYVCDLDTRMGAVQVGAMICYDREFPESARILMLEGAEVVLVPNACPMEINRLSQLRGRAYENMMAIATCNYPAGQPDCNGHSSVFDGITCAPGFAYPRETCLLETGTKPGIYMAQIDMALLRDYRKREVHGNAYRHPEKYHRLVDEAVHEPFIRNSRK
ncbi:MAG: carbon-nitrogen hydrolase family protein [Faecalibacterium sp.]|jgi:predicted amidohydrolase|nr:carbon-nitrogen hydrolase family protein [Faecalibacterium sp.]